MFGSVIKLNPVGVVVLLGAAFFFVYVYIESYTYQDDGDSVSLKRLLVLSIEAAESGGREVLNARANVHFHVTNKGKTQEGADNFLTTGDVMSNHAMLQVLVGEYPRLKVISEETEISTIKPVRISKWAASRVDAVITEDMKVPLGDLTVWVDPLDATQEYTENLLEYVTTMVCVAVRGEPVIGVIRQPSINRTVWAWNGHGVSPTLKISSETGGEKTIIVSRSHPGEVRDLVKKAFGDSVVVKPAGGAGFKVLEVISGNASAYIHKTLIKKWDICAGNAILNAIGGKMTTLEGATISYGADDSVKNPDGLLAAKRDDHQTFLSKLSQASL